MSHAGPAGSPAEAAGAHPAGWGFHSTALCIRACWKRAECMLVLLGRLLTRQAFLLEVLAAEEPLWAWQALVLHAAGSVAYFSP